MATDENRWWWISVHDTARGNLFVGAAVVQGATMKAACERLASLRVLDIVPQSDGEFGTGCYLDLELTELPKERGFLCVAPWVDRLLNEADCEAWDKWVSQKELS